MFSIAPRQDNSAYHQLGLSSGSGKEFGNGQHSNDTSLDKLHGKLLSFYRITFTISFAATLLLLQKNWIIK